MLFMSCGYYPESIACLYWLLRITEDLQWATGKTALQWTGRDSTRDSSPSGGDVKLVTAEKVAMQRSK